MSLRGPRVKCLNVDAASGSGLYYLRGTAVGRSKWLCGGREGGPTAGRPLRGNYCWVGPGDPRGNLEKKKRDSAQVQGFLVGENASYRGTENSGFFLVSVVNGGSSVPFRKGRAAARPTEAKKRKFILFVVQRGGRPTASLQCRGDHYHQPESKPAHTVHSRESGRGSLPGSSSYPDERSWLVLRKHGPRFREKTVGLWSRRSG